MARLEDQIRNFLGELCVELGFCLPPEEIAKLISKECYEADQFVKDIFLAEGMNPELDLHLFRQVKRKFTDKFGSELR